MIASMRSTPFSRSWFANSTIRIPCFVIRPTSITRPIWLYTFSVPPCSSFALMYIISAAPAIASGTVNMMTSGPTKLSNCAASTR